MVICEVAINNEYTAQTYFFPLCSCQFHSPKFEVAPNPTHLSKFCSFTISQLGLQSIIHPSNSHTPYFEPTNFLHSSLWHIFPCFTNLYVIYLYIQCQENSKLNKLNKAQNYSYLIEIKIVFNTQGNQMRQYFSSQLLFGDSQLLMSKSTFVDT